MHKFFLNIFLFLYASLLAYSNLTEVKDQAIFEQLFIDQELENASEERIGSIEQLD